MSSRSLQFLLVCTLTLLTCADTAVKVSTKHGSITGFKYTTTQKKDVDVFLNIPFAKPPVGNLRLEKPEPIDNWGERDGTKFGFDCIPHFVNASVFPSNEDCLTLNVIRPTTTPPSDGFPVLFSIHGGGYEVGSASIYGYKGFADLYVQQDVIVVTTQYRIGFLGFLSLENDDEIIENLGLWDLALSLKFVHDNIKSFGGNPEKITVFGYSAGSAAAGQLSLSPHSRDYVYSAVEMSGSPFASWALGHRVPEASLELVKELGCEKNTKTCLKNKSVSEMHKAVLAVGFTREDLSLIKWGPTIDGDFFPAPPSELIKQGRPVPSLLGISNKDAGFFNLLGKSRYIHEYYPGVEGIRTFGPDSLDKYLERFIREKDFGPNRDRVMYDIKKYFIDSYDGVKDRGFYLDKLTQILNSLCFSSPAAEELSQKTAAGWPAYAYSFDHYNPVVFEGHDIPESARGSVHASEFAYIYNLPILGKFEMEDDEKIVQNLIVDLILAMTKTGKPTEYFIPAGDTNTYLSITPKPDFKPSFYGDEWNFWKRLNVTYGYDLISLPASPAVHMKLHEEL
ncbi:unnamed protein product [Auanema sp. JU1783]|nr:unnamed protein product [Auanema sp. JU1783]